MNHLISPFFNLFILIGVNYFTILYWFCHTLTWIHHGCTCGPHPDPPSHLPPHPIPLGYPSAPAPSNLSHASNLDWQFISHMIIYMFSSFLVNDCLCIAPIFNFGISLILTNCLTIILDANLLWVLCVTVPSQFITVFWCLSINRSS